MLPIELYHDVLVARLVEADHSNNLNEKNDLLQHLKKIRCKNSIYASFIKLDSFNFEHKYETIDDFLSNNKNRIPKAVDSIIKDISSTELNIGLNRNSLYLSENGLLSCQLPSHYKFDRAVANLLGVKSSYINKDNLIVPKYSNTIRIYLEFAVLLYKPSVKQIECLIKLDIKKYFVFDQCVDSLFDPLIDKLPNFLSVQ